MIVALQQLKLCTTEIAVGQVFANDDAISNWQRLTTVTQQHFRRRTPRRFAECLCGRDRVHFDDLDSIQFRYRTNIPTFPETKVSAYSLSLTISTLTRL